MKKVILVLSLLVVFVSCKEDKSKKVETHHKKPVEVVKNDGTFKVYESQVLWKGYKPTGSHNGLVDLNEGVLAVKDNHLVGGKFIIDMNSIKVLDMPETDPYNKKLLNHLKSPDFFDTTKYPTATFEITTVKPQAENYLIEGNLTIKDVTKNISFPAMVLNKKDAITFYSDAIKIDRTDFGIKYKSKKFVGNLKDKFIDDLFDITFKIKAKKQ
jgi:hypothetical protein